MKLQTNSQFQSQLLAETTTNTKAHITIIIVNPNLAVQGSCQITIATLLYAKSMVNRLTMLLISSD
jgi:hypothetical protein